MGQALYRKYRSKKLSEIVGQDHITQTLDNAIKTGKISHAYLFTGPRGVGKTSIARILAHEINSLDYSDESIHLDIIEIDAASNRRIDEIRDLRDKVHIAPTSAKYKIYIIDEVHMLTKEAFNALLKTLEEPPEHVIFILATTEIHKLPETIVSRTQRFTFKPINDLQAAEHLRSIATSEGMTIDDEALQLLVSHAKGSFRDSISLLDQVGNSKKKIDKFDAEKLLGIAASEQIEKLLEVITNGSPSTLLQLLDKLVIEGVSPAQTAKQLASLVRSLIIEGDSISAYIELLEDLLGVQSSPEPNGLLEIILLKAQSKLSTVVNKTSLKPAIATPTDKQVVKVENIIIKQELVTPKSKLVKNDSIDWWNDLLNKTKEINNTLYGVLRMAEPEISGDELILRFNFGFHKKKIDDIATQAKIQSAIKEVTGKSLIIKTMLDKNLVAPKREIIPIESTFVEENSVDSELSNITNIFGDAEVLES